MGLFHLLIKHNLILISPVTTLANWPIRKQRWPIARMVRVTGHINATSPTFLPSVITAVFIVHSSRPLLFKHHMHIIIILRVSTTASVQYCPAKMVTAGSVTLLSTRFQPPMIMVTISETLLIALVTHF
jgi:hypothetical protein